MVTRWIVSLLLALTLFAGAQPAAQRAATPQAAPRAAPPRAAEAEPFRCWWRTSAGAVRVGEVFSIVLTCAMVETDKLTAVPGPTALDPTAIRLPPFEVMSGARAEDLRTADHRFLQYDYRVRVIGEDVIGKDVKLPELKITYKVRSRVNGDTLEGRDQVYALPPISVKVLSLVPAEANDIRDASLETFGDIDRRASRANVLHLVGGILFALAGLAAMLALIRLISRIRGRAPEARSLVSSGAILRDIGRELAAIQHAHGDGGWTPGLAARLITALRIMGATALKLPARPLASIAGINAVAGHLAVRGGWLRGTKATLPGWITPVVIAQERARLAAGGHTSAQYLKMLEQLEDVLARLTTAQYGRETTPSDQALDEALAFGFNLLRRLKVQNVWAVKKMQTFGQFRSELEQRV